MMGRRPFLKGASAMAMWRPRGDAPKPGTGGLPQRVDQQYDPPGPLVAPGGHAPNRFIGRVYISGPSGVLLSYSPTIAAGNLVASTGAAVGGTDHGNLYLAGDATYFNTGSGFLAVQIWAGQIFFQTATTEAGPWSQVGILEMAGPTGPMQLTSNAGNLELRGAAVNAVSPFQATSGTASQFSAAIDILAGGLSVIGGTVTDTLTTSGASDLDGTVTGPDETVWSSTGIAVASFGTVTADTWHNFGAPVAGWTTIVARYKGLADSGLVMVQMALTGPAVPPADGTTIFVAANGLPAAYRPDATTASLQQICYINQGSGGEMTALLFQATGAILVYGVGGTGANPVVVGTFILSTI